MLWTGKNFLYISYGMKSFVAYVQIIGSCYCTFPMTKTICTCLSLQSVFLYQLQWHSYNYYPDTYLIIYPYACCQTLVNNNVYTQKQLYW